MIADRTVSGPAGDVPVRTCTPPEGDGPFRCSSGSTAGLLGDLEDADPICRSSAFRAGCVVVSVGLPPRP